jgi:selenide,water dikinase
MTTLNKAAAEAMQKVGANACTDVTGFGLLGHLFEMTCSSKVGASIRLADVPVMLGVRELLAADMAPGGAYRTLSYLAGCNAISWDGDLTEEDKLLLTDPQTAGGLLISISAEKASELLKEMKNAGVDAARIGEMVHDPAGRIRVS